MPAARAFLRHALSPLDMHPDALDQLVLAAAEAINNVVLHAEGELFAVNVSRDDSACVLSITDSGPGFYVPGSFDMPPATQVDRRGLALMHALVDHVHVASSPTGTAVVLVQSLSSNGFSPRDGEVPRERSTERDRAAPRHRASPMAGDG